MIEDAQMKLRLTAELKAQIEAAARENNRSLNGEIVSRLTQSFQPTAETDARSELAALRIRRANFGAGPDAIEDSLRLLEERVDQNSKDIALLQKAAHQ